MGQVYVIFICMKRTLVQIVTSIIFSKKLRHLARAFLLNGAFSLLKKQPELRVYFYDSSNFGDALNIPLFRFFNQGCRYAPPYFADACAIGSILDDLLLTKSMCRNGRTLHVYGSGFMHGESSEKEFCRPLEIHALRGKLSRARCEEILGCSLKHVPLGDPGLLIPYIFPEAREEKKYDVGIISHYADDAALLRQRVNLKELSSMFIDVTQPPESFIREVSQCRFILSSAMHGLICADSLGIPNAHVIMSDNVKGKGFKFHDYYSVYGSVTYCPVDLRAKVLEDADILELQNSYSVSQVEVKAICERLISVFQQLSHI